jgi:hypothetical protein
MDLPERLLMGENQIEYSIYIYNINSISFLQVKLRHVLV